MYATGNTTEAEQARRIGDALAADLRAAGFNVRVAEAGTSISSGARMREANVWPADLYITLHTDAGGGHGCTVMCHPGRESHPVIQSVYKALAAVTPTADRGVRARGDLLEINQTTMLCCYIEASFHDNVTDATWIINHTTEIARAIAQGVVAGNGGVAIPTPVVPPAAPTAPVTDAVIDALSDNIIGVVTTKRYQAAHGLDPDGIWGELTMTSLLGLAGVAGDGWIDLDNQHQVDLAKEHFPAVTVFRVGTSVGQGSNWWRQIQTNLLHTAADGIPGPNDAAALQVLIREGRI
ncbi:MAG: N-acetylmuramoyl-L-alanine amidase [Propionibacteriaceae bacterium]|nr:N-acetylmuramoyl-L-alanine amidase [Propionibacteriaceae bacterium]